MTDRVRVLVGHSPRREYGRRMRETVYLNVELRRRDSVSPHMTIDHRPIGQYTELAITADIYEGKRDIGGGQSIDALREIANDLNSQPEGFSRDRLRRIVDIWERWHLNGMMAACVHQRGAVSALQRVFPGYEHDRQRWEVYRELFCPEGYSYGHAWLVEPLPEDIEREIRSTFGFPGWLGPLAEDAAQKGKDFGAAVR